MKSRRQPARYSAHKCVECREPLSAQAKRCLKCGSYQNRWKRKLQFITAVAAALTLLGGVVLYTFKLGPSLRKELAWRTEIRVIALDTSHGVTVLNTGDGPVLLLNVSLEIEGVGTRSIPINKRIEPGQMVEHDMKKLPSARTRSVLLAHVTSAEWREAVVAARSLDDSSCISAVAFADIDPSYALFAEAGRRDPHHFPALHASAVIHYFDFRAGGNQLRIPAHAFLFRGSDCPPYPSELPRP
jgi:ribosomal protein L40E